VPECLRRSRANTATPLSSQATASPSIRHDRTLGAFTASHDRRVAWRPVVAVPGQQPDANRITAGHQLVAVVLDLRSHRRTLGGSGKEGSM
jgi:hypothetical protein